MKKFALTAREAALDVLNRFNIKSHNAAVVLHKQLADTQNRGMATDIVFGVIRNLNLIDHLLFKIADVKADRVEKRLLNIIRIGTYEIIYCPDQAQYAIVDQAVSLAKSQKAKGFANAVLRNLLRALGDRQIDCSFDQKSFSSKTLPVNINSAARFIEDVLPDPEKSPVRYLSICFSLPDWLIEEWIGEHGIKKTVEICFGCNRRPSVYLRVNSLRTNTEALVETLNEKGAAAEKIRDGLIHVSYTAAISELDEFKKGLFSVQDATAFKVVEKLSPSKGDIIADLCSAPGTKTTHLAELMQNDGCVLATDINPTRLDRLKENISRLKLNIIKITPWETAFEKIKDAGAKTILLDVPCSNTGVFAKRCELRHRIKKKAVKELSQIQLDLLNKTARELSQCSKICYSTCSISRDENSQVVNKFLLQNPAFHLTHEELTLPSSRKPDNDGGYFAILEK